VVEAIGCRVAATAEQQEHWQLSFRSNISNSKQAAASGCAFIAAATTADVGKERDGKNWRAGKLARYWGKLQFFRNLDCIESFCFGITWSAKNSTWTMGGRRAFQSDHLEQRARAQQREALEQRVVRPRRAESPGQHTRTEKAKEKETTTKAVTMTSCRRPAS